MSPRQPPLVEYVPTEKKFYINFLKKNRDVPVWTYIEMPDLDSWISVQGLSKGKINNQWNMDQHRCTPT